jgi:hypothetical protein
LAFSPDPYYISPYVSPSPCRIQTWMSKTLLAKFSWNFVRTAHHWRTARRPKGTFQALTTGKEYNTYFNRNKNAGRCLLSNDLLSFVGRRIQTYCWPIQ